MDSVDLLPFLTAKAPLQSDRTLFWRSGEYRVARSGNWKLQLSQNPKKAWLFDLASDPTEQKNLASMEPLRVNKLTELIIAHDGEMPKPLWPTSIEHPIRIDVPLDAPWNDDQENDDQEYVCWSN